MNSPALNPVAWGTVRTSINQRLPWLSGLTFHLPLTSLVCFPRPNQAQPVYHHLFSLLPRISFVNRRGTNLSLAQLRVRGEDIGTDEDLGEVTLSVLEAMAKPPGVFTVRHSLREYCTLPVTHRPFYFLRHNDLI